jgi:hypothetical protein
MKKIILILLCAAIIGVLAFSAAITVTFVPGVAALYPAAAFEAAFGSWFGIWGSIGCYIGLLVSGSLSGWFSIWTGLILSLSDFILAIAPALLVKYRVFKPDLPAIKDAVIFVFGTLFLGSLPGSLLYNYMNLFLGVLDGWSSFWAGVIGWNVGNLIVLVLIGIPVMKIGTPIIERFDIMFNAPRNDKI